MKLSALKFKATPSEVFKFLIVQILLLIVTLYIYLPWFINNVYEFYVNNLVSTNNEPQLTITYKKDTLGVFLLFLVNYLLIIVTLGIYTFWAVPKIANFFAERTSIEIKEWE